LHSNPAGGRFGAFLALPPSIPIIKVHWSPGATPSFLSSVGYRFSPLISIKAAGARRGH
jgi:hypothetical protein